MDPLLDITIPGRPVPKGRPRLLAGGRVYTPKQTKAWEGRACLLARLQWGSRAPYDAPCHVEVIATYQGAEDGYYTGGADLDNIVKAALDALQLAGVYTTDRTVVKLTASKLTGRMACVRLIVKEVEK